MVALVSNPTTLSDVTRFRPKHTRVKSRSPSRSPIRKARFIARELDPLLNNLSPDSTLRALEETDTIAKGSTGQDALAKSIADASTTERELGIRAAVAAQKLRQWRQEIGQWPWPDRKGQAAGAGFLPYQNGQTAKQYSRTLPFDRIQELEERIEEVRDAIESLGLEEVKDYVFSAHIPSSPSNGVDKTSPTSKNYGRMRDFTALITATVVQALPDLAHLDRLLETWDIRLSVLRQVPNVVASLDSLSAGMNTASRIIHDPKKGPLVSQDEVKTTKAILGDKVSSLGAQIDKLLDLLEGREDSLPPAWIETLEDIENKYAQWVVEAENIVARNQTSRASIEQNGDTASTTSPRAQITNSHHAQTTSAGMEMSSSLASPLPAAKTSQTSLRSTDSRSEQKTKKPLLQVKAPSRLGHSREVSGVSVADSDLSGYSLENAEIVDVKATKVLPSPIVGVVENPRNSKDELSRFSQYRSSELEPPRPLELHRASTASFEILSKPKIKQLDLRRSCSADLLSQATQPSPPGTPTTALRQLNGQEVEPPSPNRDRRKSAGAVLMSQKASAKQLSNNVKEHSEAVTNSLPHISTIQAVPAIPRRSSKRLTLNGMDGLSQTRSKPEEEENKPARVAPEAVEETTPSATLPKPAEDDKLSRPTSESVVDSGVSFTESRGSKSVDSIYNGPADTRPSTPPPKVEVKTTLEEKIRKILTNLPEKIRLADGSDANDLDSDASGGTNAVSEPTAVLKMSPVRKSKIKGQELASGIRVYHLSRPGQARDAPPIKLFVRAVGENGERVMVRVGGGWADLAEYLREYSSHHGGRTLAENNMELAELPHQRKISRSLSPGPLLPSDAERAKAQSLRSISPPPRPASSFDMSRPRKQSLTSSSARPAPTFVPSRKQAQTSVSSVPGSPTTGEFQKKNLRSAPIPTSRFSSHLEVPRSSNITPALMKPRPKPTVGVSIEAGTAMDFNTWRAKKTTMGGRKDPSWMPPPVPPIPAFYSVQNSALLKGGRQIGGSAPNLSRPSHAPRSNSRLSASGLSSRPESISESVANSSESSIQAVPYTPMGAAGPASNPQRPVSLGAYRSLSEPRMAFNKTTTQTTTSNKTEPENSTSRPTSRFRMSRASSPTSTHTVTAKSREKDVSADALSLKGKKKGKGKEKEGEASGAASIMSRRSRLSLGDVSSLKRVFLRRKKE